MRLGIQFLPAGILMLLGWTTLALAQPAAPTPEQAEFFEKRVRPVLAERCYNCHGTQLQSGGLRLDSPSALLRPTEKGHLPVVPGNPSQSAMIQAIRYDGAVKMPPQGKLPARDIESLMQWVKMGAPWPAAVIHDSKEGEAPLLDAARRLWSLQPVVKPPVPSVKNSDWVKNPIDAFLLAKQEAKGVTASLPADKRILLRRVTYGLTGAPPTPEEMDAFLADTSPSAYEKVVDRLLASPRYGERWGRYWLDIARYSDSKGNSLLGFGDEDSRYPFAYTYRDWVIRAFNEDLPYDKFLLYQIAADRLPLGEDHRPLAALGFLTLGRRSFNGDPDIMDDRIDVVMRGTQGLTVTCARCHDHKFDPIPTKDYYSLYGVFAASIEKTIPLASGPGAQEAMRAFEKEKQAREAKITQFLAAKQVELQAQTRGHFADYLQAANDPIETNNGGEETISGLKTGLISRWREVIKASRASFHPVFAPWNAFAALPYNQFNAKAGALAARFALNSDQGKRINPLIAKAFSGAPPTSLESVAVRYGRVLGAVDLHWQQALKSAREKGAPPPTGLPDKAEDEIRQALYVNGGLASLPAEQIEGFLKEKDRARLQALRRGISQLMASPMAPPHALTLEDAPAFDNPRVFVRGNPETPGEAVPRRFLLCLAGEMREPFKQGSGRLELAQDIANPQNPLTARVMVNRIWLAHFGQGIVRTPSDFGTRGEAPSHPELLDWLAATFVENGWSVKKLHKLILMSNAYQQSDEDNPENRKLDADNRFVWRMNRRRLDFEAMRDSLLIAGGGLDETQGGRSVEITRPPFSRRRTVYAMVDRANLPSMYRIFDFANPDAHTAERFVTTSPQQSLFLLNSPFVVEQARRLAARPEFSSQDIPARIAALYRLLYERAPSEKEIGIGQKFLQAAIARQAEARSSKPSPWRYGYGEVDESTKRVKSFTPFEYWTGDTWQVGMFLPDPDFGGVSLDAVGGTPGSDPQHAVIRRWTAPKDGFVSVTGQVRHVSITGDGVRVRIVSSRAGELGSWKVFYTSKETNIANISVKQGDTLDFVVDCAGDDVEDRFLWSPNLTMTSTPVGGSTAPKSRFREAPIRWNAQDDFGGPPEETARPLTPWEKYVQILLLSNEFAFVD